MFWDLRHSHRETLEAGPLPRHILLGGVLVATPLPAPIRFRASEWQPRDVAKPCSNTRDSDLWPKNTGGRQTSREGRVERHRLDTPAAECDLRMG